MIRFDTTAIAMIQAKGRGIGIPKMLRAIGNNKPPELVFHV